MPIIKHLIADQFGSHIGKFSERLKVTSKDATLAQAPLMHLETVSVLSKGVSISADALAACTERGIPIFFLSSRGEPYATIYAAGLSGTVITRREQLRAFDDRRGAQLGVAFAVGKLQNQAITLKYLAKNRKESEAGDELTLVADELLDAVSQLERLLFREQAGGLTIDEIRGSLMGIEGDAARRYWQAVRAILPEAYGWTSREGRGATDPVNSLLNYGYGILYGQIERALVLAGLDPFAGFVHVDRPGKPSLTLDLIEEFRQVAVDRVVFGLVNRRFVVEQDEQKRLSEATRKSFAQHITDHLESEVRHAGKRFALRQVMQMQAREIAAFVCGRRADYIPFKASW